MTISRQKSIDSLYLKRVLQYAVATMVASLMA